MEVLLSKEYITGLLTKKGMSKAVFASKMGIVRQNLDAMLDSKKKDINTVIKMAEVLEMPLMEFIGMQSSEGVKISGFVKVNDTVKEISSKKDVEDLLDYINQQQ